MNHMRRGLVNIGREVVELDGQSWPFKWWFGRVASILSKYDQGAWRVSSGRLAGLMWTKGSRTCHMVRINLFGGSGLQNIMNPHYDVGPVLVGTMTPHKKRIVRCVLEGWGGLSSLENIAVDVLFTLSLMVRVVSCVMVMGLVWWRALKGGRAPVTCTKARKEHVEVKMRREQLGRELHISCGPSRTLSHSTLRGLRRTLSNFTEANFWNFFMKKIAYNPGFKPGL